MTAKAKLFAEGALTAIGSISAPVANLALIPLLAKNLSISEYGTLSIVLAYASFLSVIIGEPNTRAFGRYFAQAGTSDRRSAYVVAFAVATIQIVVLVSVVLALIYFLIPPRAKGLLIGDLSGPLFLLAFILAVCTCVASFIFTLFNTSRMRLIATTQKILEASLRLISIYAISALHFISPSIATICLAASSIASAVASLVLAMTKLPKRLPAGDAIRKSTMEMRRYAKPFYVWTILLSAKSVVERLVVLKATSTEGVAQFTAILQIGFFPFLAFSGFFFAFYSPIAFQHSPESAEVSGGISLQTRLLSIAKALILIATLPTVCAVFYGDLVITLLTSREYAVYSQFLPLMIISGAILASAQIIEIRILADSGLSRLTLSKSIVYLAGTFLTIMLTINLGLPGAFVSNVAFSCAYLVWVLHGIGTRRRFST